MWRISEAEPLLTPRLRLVPTGPGNAADFWLVHNDDAVVPWYDGWRPSRKEDDDQARRIAESWRLHGVHKWIAYDREIAEVVGRGGLSPTPVDDDWAQLYAFLPDERWVREAHESERPFRALVHWLEVGWALRGEFWGRAHSLQQLLDVRRRERPSLGPLGLRRLGQRRHVPGQGPLDHALPERLGQHRQLAAGPPGRRPAW